MKKSVYKLIYYLSCICYREDKLFWGHVTAASAGKADLDGTGETTVPPLRSKY